MKTNLFSIVLRQFLSRKLRSALTVIGITIGISALISLTLLGGALKSGVISQLDSFGTDIVLVAPKAALGSGGAPTGIGKFTTHDVSVVENVPQVKKVSAYVSATLKVDFGRQSKRYEIQGAEVDADYADFIDQKILVGRYLESTDTKALNIGYRIAKEEFDKEILVGNVLKINNESFTVVGIFESAGELAKDTIIYAPIDSVRETLGSKDAVTALSAQIEPGADLEMMEKRIFDALKRSRGEEDFSTITPIRLREQIGDLLSVVNIVVYCIAFISIVVASLGITNSLYTSVLQRTKEIGTMKAVGATNSQILLIFIIESAILGFVGGVLGVLVGLFFAYGLTIPLNAFGIYQFHISVDFLFLIGCVVFSVLLGIVSGFLPALRAARLRPVDALRHE